MIQIESILSSVIVSTIITPIIFFILKTIFGAKLNSHYNKALEKHKHDLSLVTEQQKFEYSRKISDFNLYVAKKHEVYSELYKLLLITEGSLMRLVGSRLVPSFKEYLRSGMEDYLRDYPIVEDYIPKLLENWEENRNRCIEEIRKYLTIVDFSKADKSRNDATDFFLVNRLYMSEDVEKGAEELFSIMAFLHVHYRSQLIDHYYNKKMAPEIDKKRAVEKELLSSIKQQMRKEMSIGYYDDNEKKDWINRGSK